MKYRSYDSRPLAPARFSAIDDPFRQAVEACPAGMILVSENGAIELCNGECDRMFGYEPEELVGAPVEWLVPSEARGGHEAQRQTFLQAPSKRLMAAGRPLNAVRKDGSRFPVEIGLTPITIEGRRCVLAFVIDIAERRSVEDLVRRRNEDLELANERLAQFAYVASHDIQEPLRKIVAFSDLLQTAVAADDREEMLMASDVMRASALRTRRLVGDVLALAQSMNDVLDIAPVSVRALVEEALQGLSHTIEESHAALSVSIEDVSTQADRFQGVRMVQNLVSNAIKFHKPGQVPTVTIGAERVDRRLMRLVVEDCGVGFTPAQGAQLFQPFRRLHRRDQFDGSGIGLATCKAIADRLGWELSAISRVNEGSRFMVTFPVANEPST
jgi:PAS domain S-box-containing protein